MLLLQKAGPPKDPDFVEKYRKLQKKQKQIIHTISLHHGEVYSKAANAHLMDGGMLDLDKLQDADTRKKFVDEMAKSYRERAAKVLKSGVKPDDEFENELMTQAVYQTSKEQIRQVVDQYKKKYDVDVHGQAARQLVGQLQNRLRGITSTHISDKNIDDILKYTGAEAAAAKRGYDLNKGAVSREEAVEMLEEYETSGGITKDYIENAQTLFKKKKK